MNPFVALCIWTFAILFGGFYLGYRLGWLTERDRCVKVAYDSSSFCERNVDDSIYGPFWKARAEEGALIAMKIRETSDLRTE